MLYYWDDRPWGARGASEPGPRGHGGHVLEMEICEGMADDINWEFQDPKLEVPTI